MANTDNAYRALMNSNQNSDSDTETAIIDLITDLLHLAEEYGEDTDAILRMATTNFEAERST